MTKIQLRPKENQTINKNDFIDGKIHESQDEKNQDAVNVKGNLILEIPIEEIVPDENQPRKEFELAHLEELAASLKESGFIQPIIVSVKEDGKYKIIVGERRFRAAKIAHIKNIPAITKVIDDDKKKLLLQYEENAHRVDLNPVEEALALKEIMDVYDLNQKELAKEVKKSRQYIGHSLSIAKLVEKCSARSIKNINRKKLVELAIIKDEPFFEKILEKTKNGLSLRELSNEIKKEKEKILKKDEKRRKNMYEDQEHILNFVDVIDDMLLKFKVRYRNDLTEVDEDSLKIEILERLKAVADTVLSKYPGSRKIEIDFKIKDDSKSYYENNYDSTNKHSTLLRPNKIEIQFPGTSTSILVNSYLYNINKYNLINYTSTKEEVINFIKNIIDIQEDILIKTDKEELIDKWNYIAFYPSKIEKLNNFYFSLLNKNSFKMSKEQTKLKKIALQQEEKEV